MKTPSPSKIPSTASTRCSPTVPVSPDKLAARRPPLTPSRSPTSRPGEQMRIGDRERSLTVMGHSMISRDSENCINVDLRLITGRMAQTLDTYEIKAANLAKQHIQDLEDQLDDIDNPKLKVQIKQLLEDYKRMAIEREEILMSVEKWFDNCGDEFLEELEEFESQFAGEESLTEHITQAKDLISKIKFINGKIVEFQSNGMSTNELIAKKKTLEGELMKKKVIVDNTNQGSDNYVMWRQRIDNVLVQIKESSANEIDKALLDLKLCEAADAVSSQMIVAERQARRTGVLFKNVKELEYTNGQLADENSFLKARLSKVDKHFKDQMYKKVAKLDNALEELGDVRYLKGKGKGQSVDDVDRRVNGAGTSLEMEMIENFQEHVRTLDAENRELITKVESIEEHLDNYKEEVKTLESKLSKALTSADRVRNSVIAVEHPLVKLDSSASYSLGTVSNSGFSEGGTDHRMSISEKSRRERTLTADRKRRGSNMVSTITIQDGQELDMLRADNEFMKGQLKKVKNSLNVVRRNSILPKKQTKTTQTKMSWNRDEQRDEGRISGSDSDCAVPEEEEEEEQSTSVASSPTKIPKRPRKKKPRRVREPTSGNEGPDESSEYESSEDEESDLTSEELSKLKQERANTIVDNLKSYVRKQDRERRRSTRKKSRAERGNRMDERDELKPVRESGSDSEESEEEEEPNTDKGNVVKTKSIMKKKDKKKKKYNKVKPQVKFEEPVEKEETFEAPTFQRISTPTVADNSGSIETIEKLKEELKDFLAYGQKFITDIHQCVTETADNELAVEIDQYSDLEQKIMGLETSLNILLYGIDLGMYLVTPRQSRPSYSPLPFENKLYFQENLTKYLREKYPKLNVNAMKMFDPELDPLRNMNPANETPTIAPTSPTFKPYAEFTQHQGGYNNFNNFTMPVTTTPEPKARKPPMRIHKRKPVRRQEAVGKIEEIMASLTSGTMFGNKTARSQAKKLLDDRSFADIVDHVMPKEIAMEYMKLIQPTHDTLGKKQYHDKLKRGVMKVKDLLDLVNLNSNQGVIKGLPSNKLGESRARMTKVNDISYLASKNIVGLGNPLTPGLEEVRDPGEIYRNKLTRGDERVRASLDDYPHHDEELRDSGSLTIMELPISSRQIAEKKMKGAAGPERPDPKEEMFDLSKSNPSMDGELAPDKRHFLPMVTQNLLPTFAGTKKFPQRNSQKKIKKQLSNPFTTEQTATIADILNLEWEKPKLAAFTTKLPIIKQGGLTEQQSFP